MSTFHILDGFEPYVNVPRGGSRLRPRNPLTNTSGAYCVTIIETGMVYVGSTSNLNNRVTRHPYMLKQDKHFNTKLQAAYNTDSDIEITIKPTATIAEAQKIEQQLVDHFRDTGYLCNQGIVDVTRSRFGTSHTEEHRRKIGDTLRGRTMPESVKQQQSLDRKAFLQTDKGRAAIQAISKPVTIDGIIYKSIAEAKRVLHQGFATIKQKALHL